MARKRRSHNWRECGRGGRKPPPGVGNLLAWLLPFAAISGLADWMVTAQIMQHYRKYGHVCFPGIGTAAALSFTITTISVPFLWLQARRRSDRSR